MQPSQMSIIVQNSSSSPIEAFVSTYSSIYASDAWFTLPPGSNEVVERQGWELVAFRVPGVDTAATRAGVYVSSGARVVFNSLKDIKTQ